MVQSDPKTIEELLYELKVILGREGQANATVMHTWLN